MKVSLTTKTSLIIVIVASVIFYIGAMSINLCVERLQNSQLASKQFQLVEVLDSVVLDLNRAEEREREYLQTGSLHALEANRVCFAHIDESLASLRSILSDNTRYMMLLDELTESVSFRKSCAQEVMNLRNSVGMDYAMQRSRLFDEQRLTQHVEWVAHDVSRTINREMTDRINELDKGSVTTLAGIAVILCSSLLACVILVLVVNRYVQERYLAEKTLREAQQALTEKEARMRALVDTAPDGIVTVRPSGRIESANAVFGQMMGCPLTNIIERDINHFIPDFLLNGGEKSGVEKVVYADTRPIGAVRELTAVRDNGERFAVEVSVNVVKLGKHNVYTGIIRDITERKEVEERVKDFYSMVSHELRTPLASIRTALGIMEAGSAADASNQTNLVVKIASNETDRLMRLINDILDMRKIESGKLDLLMDVLEAGTIVGRAIDGVKGLANEANLTIITRVEPKVYLYCDEDRTLQVLTNFLANAIKFSPKGSTITVECTTVGDKCRFAVTDQGPGLPKAEIHKLFGRFEQLRSTDGKQRPGSGLGLAIAKAIVEQHRGQIGVEQPETGGSTFWFSLPLAEDEADEGDEEHGEEEHGDGGDGEKKDALAEIAASSGEVHVLAGRDADEAVASARGPAKEQVTVSVENNVVPISQAGAASKLDNGSAPEGEKQGQISAISGTTVAGPVVSSISSGGSPKAASRASGGKGSRNKKGKKSRR